MLQVNDVYKQRKHRNMRVCDGGSYMHSRNRLVVLRLLHFNRSIVTVTHEEMVLISSLC